MKKKNNIIQLINQFIEKDYPDVNGVMLFGSASFNTKNFQDIDLLFVDEKFSFSSKSNVYYLGNQFSIHKISSNDVYNVLAKDYNVGIYKHIFETGFIIKDELKLLMSIKQYASKDYPDNNKVVTHNLNKTIYKINEVTKSLRSKQPLTENFLCFSNLIGYIIDYVILLDGKINFESSKHKSKYLHQYHINEAMILNDIISSYRKNFEEAFERILNFKQLLKIPETTEYSNDYLVDIIDSLDSTTIYVPGAYDKLVLNKIYNLLSNFDVPFYSYWIDENNIEESGLYFILDNTDFNHFSLIRNELKLNLPKTIFFFPYNMLYNQEIKFGGKEAYDLSKELFNILEPVIYSSKDDIKKRMMLVLFCLEKIKITAIEANSYYFYKTVNNQHNLSIIEIIEKEKTFKMNSKYSTFSWINYKIEIDLEFDFLTFNKISKYFRLQIFDRILSMMFLTDNEKRQTIQMLIDQNSTNV